MGELPHQCRDMYRPVTKEDMGSKSAREKMLNTVSHREMKIKSTKRYGYAPLLVKMPLLGTKQLKLKRRTIPALARLAAGPPMPRGEKRKATSCPSFNSRTIPNKNRPNTYSPGDPAILLVDIHPRKMKIYVPMDTTLLIMTPHWGQPKRPLTGQ